MRYLLQVLLSTPDAPEREQAPERSAQGLGGVGSVFLPLDTGEHRIKEATRVGEYLCDADLLFSGSAAAHLMGSLRQRLNQLAQVDALGGHGEQIGP